MPTISVDPDTRIITLVAVPVSGFSELDVARDIYSAGKDLWRTTSALQSLRFPFSPVGGNIISATERVGRYVFLNNTDGWRLQPYDQDHELRLVGNIFAVDPQLPLWLSRAGRTITIQVERSAQALLMAGEAGIAAEVWNTIVIESSNKTAKDALKLAALKAALAASLAASK